MKTTLQKTVRWGISLSLAIVSLASMWACDFDFGITVSGKNVKVTSVAGAADNIEAKIKAGGKKCEVSRNISGTVGKDGCITISGTVCGVEINEKICGLQPGAPFCYDIKVSGGGMAAIEVPISYSITGTTTYMSSDGTDSTTVELSDTPFGYALLHPLIAESGKKIIYARWKTGYDDSHVDGIITAHFSSATRGKEMVKFALLGEVRLFMPGTTMPPPYLADSVFLFVEYPLSTYDFGAIVGPEVIPIHSVSGTWKLMAESDALAAGLPDPKTYSYIRFEPDGATLAELAKDYTLSAKGKTIDGAYYSSSPALGGSAYVRFSRADILAVTDSLRYKTSAVLQGATTTTSFTTNFAITETINPVMGVRASDLVTDLSIVPNPTHGEATIGFELKASSEVSISLLDEKGNTIRSLFSGTADAGSHEVKLSEQKLAEGIYFLRFRTVSHSDNTVVEEMRKIVIVR